MSKKPSFENISSVEPVNTNRKLRKSFGFDDEFEEKNVELFAGAGGFGAGAAMANTQFDIAINHNPVALAVHKVNFPHATQMINDVFEYNPIDVLISQGVPLYVFDSIRKWKTVTLSKYAVHHLHLSPDCTFFSGAKGGTLGRHTVCGDDCGVDHTSLDQNTAERIRGLAWVGIGWAAVARPRRITLENVAEFQKWGPTIVNENGDIVPDKAREGETFEAFKGVLSNGIDRYVPIELPKLVNFLNPNDIPKRKRKVYSKNEWENIRAWIVSLSGYESLFSSLKPWHGWKKEHPTLNDIRKFLKPFLGKDYDEEMLINGLGYEVEFKELVAADFGAPTSRKRLFMIARCDGVPIEWPEPTHGDPNTEDVKSGKLLPWHTAGECIDWSVVAPSIFDTKEEIKKSLGISVKRPLAKNSMHRLAYGMDKFVTNNDKPFIVKNMTSNIPRPVDNPLSTILTGNHHYLAIPKTAPFIQTYYGETNGKHIRGNTLDKPLHTITSGGQRHGLVIPYITGIDNASSGKSAVWSGNRPLTTIVTEGRHALTAAYVLNSKGTDLRRMPIGNEANSPMTTVTANDTHGVVVAHLQRDFGQSIGSSVHNPVPTITASGGGKTSLIASYCIKMKGTNLGYGCDAPVQTITSGGLSHGVVSSHLYKYYGADIYGQSINEPIHTLTTKERFGLITESLSPELPMDDDLRYKAWQVARMMEVYADHKLPTIGGIPLPRKRYIQTKAGDIIYDIGMRMLTERELYTAQGFEKTFVYNPEIEVVTKDGKVKRRKVTKTEAVRMVGNSVPPHYACAIITALNNSEEKWNLQKINEAA